MNPKVILRIMLFMAAILVAGQTLFLMMNIFPTSFEGIGYLSTQTISLILLQIVILSCIAGYIAWRSALGKDSQSTSAPIYITTLPFIVGLILSMEGLIAINLSDAIISGTTSTIMISTGLMLYTLGMLSMVTFIQNEWITHFSISTPFLALIVITLLMLPPAFLFV